VAKEEVMLKYQSVMEEFLALRKWKDEPDVDLENRTIALATGVDFADQTGRLIIEIDEDSDLFDVYFYFDIKCKKDKLEQMALLMNHIHQRWAFGRFESYPDGYIRWRHRCDFEGSQPTGVSLNHMVSAGWSAMEQYATAVAAVALTRQNAQEAIEEYDAERERRRKAAENEVTEL